ncbi:MAG: stage II sporulation protein M [Anaerolineae bacterium]|nr:stage II sporulation protein M [Anaerolineae bacterium]
MLANIRPALMVTRREVRDQFRDWRIIIPIIVLTVLFPGLMNFVAEEAIDFVQDYGAELVAERLIPFLLMVVGFFPASFSLIIALESFVGEKERGSIEPLLTSPLSDFQLYIGKLIAVMVPPILASTLGIGVYLFSVYRDIGWVIETSLLVQIVSLTYVHALVMVSGAVVISTQATSVRAANLLASFIIVPMAMLMQGESMVMFWGLYDSLWWAILGMVIIAGLLIRTGIGHFNREELLGRELDVLDFRWSLRLFRSRFIGEATNLVSWYRGELWSSLKEVRLPFVLLVGISLVAVVIGAGLAAQFPIPSELIQIHPGEGQLADSLESVTLLSPEGIPIIWLHNLRVVLLATLIGLFTYGVVGILVIMLPFVVIGYFLATVSSVGVAPMDLLTGFILPHGIFEIPAILLAGAAILRMGGHLAASSDGKKISEGVLSTLADWAKIVVGLIIPLLLIAAIIEATVTPKIALMVFGG